MFGVCVCFFLYKIIYLNKNGRRGERRGETVSVFLHVSFNKLPALPRPPCAAEYLVSCVLLKCKCVDFYPLYCLGRAGLTGIRHQLTAKSLLQLPPELERANGHQLQLSLLSVRHRASPHTTSLEVRAKTGNVSRITPLLTGDVSTRLRQSGRLLTGCQLVSKHQSVFSREQEKGIQSEIVWVLILLLTHLHPVIWPSPPPLTAMLNR